MDNDFKRRVERNTFLKYENALSPLFEAVMNSIDAIRDANRRPGKIEIDVDRDRSQARLSDDSNPDAYPVKSFTIRDDGIGVTTAHYNAFNMADTAFRADHGGKGVGRFLWLKAFDHAEINSTFVGDDGQRYTRTFDLCLTKQGIERPASQITGPTTPIGTEVKLCNYRMKYQKEVPKPADVIARRLIEHFLRYFVLGIMPTTVILDSGNTYSLQKIFSEEVDQRTQSHSSFTIVGQSFTIHNFLVAHSFQSAHRLYFCSDDQMVLSKPLAGRVHNLGGGSIHHEGNSLMYAGYVSGEYLNTCSNSARTSFDISDDEDSSFGPCWESLVSGAVEQANMFLEPYTKPIKEQKEERIRNFTRNVRPQFRYVVKHRQDLVDTIPPHISDDKLDQELYRINQISDADIRLRQDEFMTALQQGPADWESFRAKYDTFLEEWNESGMAKLAEHVIHRKATLDFLRASIRITESGKYNLEKAVHRLIFPLNATSDDLGPEQMNLWIIDEKLAYHYYLASNKEFRTQEVKIDSQKKPDILIYHGPAALVENEAPFSSITILEFKRPRRDDYTPKDNPVRQICEYIELIKSRKATDRAGRPIPYRKGMRFYAFALCDVTETLRGELSFYGELTPSPDGDGYFGYLKQFDVWIEIMGYDKLVGDAERRNAALFEQLRLPRK
jgi:hypothetical protein